MFIWTIADLLKYGFITIILIVAAFVFLVLKYDDYRQKKLKKKFKSTINELMEHGGDGWVYSYEPDTRYIGVNHPKGGKKSLLHFPFSEDGKQYGDAIAEFLNRKQKDN